MTSKTDQSKEREQQWRKAHEEAVAKGSNIYVDPATGYQVFTSAYLRARGYCCESGCRHCPYGFNEDGET